MAKTAIRKWIANPDHTPSLVDKIADWTALEKAGGEAVLRGRDVLDIGPWFAIDALLLAGKARRYVTVDCSEEILGWTRRVVPYVETVRADAADLPLENYSFDVVLDFSTFDDTDDPLACYSEAVRVLRMRGLLVSRFDDAQGEAERIAILNRLGMSVRTECQGRVLIAEKVRRYAFKKVVSLSNYGNGDMHRYSAMPARVAQLPSVIYPLTIDPSVLSAAGAAGAALHNPSVAVHGGRLWAVVRAMVDNCRTHNFMGRVNDEWSLEGVQPMRDRAPGEHNTSSRTSGYEDCRLFVLNGKLAASATICDRVVDDTRPKIAVLELSEDHDVAQCHVQPSSHHEKNWMPLVEDDALRFVYTMDPMVVLRYDPEARAVTPSAADLPSYLGFLRGGSQLIAYEGGYLAVVHQVHEGKPAPTYLHRFVRFDRELRMTRMSEPFYFQELGVEFCAGLAAWNGKFVLSFGLKDSSANLAVVDEAVVEQMLISKVDTILPKLPGWCTPEKGRRLEKLATDSRAKLCVELGVFGGRSLVALALGLAQNGFGRVDGIDPYEKAASQEGQSDNPENYRWWGSVDYENILSQAASGIEQNDLGDYARIVRAKSLDVVDQYEDGSIDILHQDSTHTEEASLAEVEVWARKIRQGGYWVADDVNWSTNDVAGGHRYTFLRAQEALVSKGFKQIESYDTWAIFQHVGAQ